MKKNTLLKVLNPVLLLLLINQIVSGVFGHVLSHEAFEVLHQGGGMVFLVLSLVHLILNGNWIKATYVPRA